MDRVLKEMQESDQVVHLLSKSNAERLIKGGFVRATVIDPLPDDGKIAVNLTSLGRSQGHIVEAGPTVAVALVGPAE